MALSRDCFTDSLVHISCILLHQEGGPEVFKLGHTAVWDECLNFIQGLLALIDLQAFLSLGDSLNPPVDLPWYLSGS